jgi:hypothetical protein
MEDVGTSTSLKRQNRLTVVEPISNMSCLIAGFFSCLPASTANLLSGYGLFP